MSAMLAYAMLPWTPPQRAAVERALDEHPPASGRCAQAARAILPHATKLDADAGALVIEPTEGIYVETTHEYGGQPWFHHVTVDAQAHLVDGMTGVDGHPGTSYLGAFFHHTDALSLRPVQDDDWEWL
jgi:hypothetical protein